MNFSRKSGTTSGDRPMEIGEIKITALTPGRCKVCATMHRPEEPHDRSSLFYLVRFYQKHRRFPSWEDAMSHCTEERKAALREELSAR